MEPEEKPRARVYRRADGTWWLCTSGWALGEPGWFRLVTQADVGSDVPRGGAA